MRSLSAWTSAACAAAACSAIAPASAEVFTLDADAFPQGTNLSTALDNLSGGDLSVRVNTSESNSSTVDLFASRAASDPNGELKFGFARNTDLFREDNFSSRSSLEALFNGELGAAAQVSVSSDNAGQIPVVGNPLVTLTAFDSLGAIIDTDSLLATPSPQTLSVENTLLADIARITVSGQDFFDLDDLVLTTIPEPGSLALLGLGCGLIGSATWRRRRTA